MHGKTKIKLNTTVLVNRQSTWRNIPEDLDLVLVSGFPCKI